MPLQQGISPASEKTSNFFDVPVATKVAELLKNNGLSYCQVFYSLSVHVLTRRWLRVAWTLQ